MFVNARAIIERETCAGTEIVVQVRNKPQEGGKWIELPGGRVEEFESLVGALRREIREETGLELSDIEGLSTKVDTAGTDTNVECLAPLAVYQTTQGPVDSMGVYFRCKAKGQLLTTGDDTEEIQWIPIRRIAEWLKDKADRFSWVDRAGLLFYLKQRGGKHAAPKLLLDVPDHLETERLYLRCYEPGDGPWYYAMSQKNRTHLTRYESDNVVMAIQSVQDAETVVRDLAADWVARNCFFMGAFDKKTNEFVAQIYVGPVNWGLPEFEIGYFVDKDHEGQGFVTEALNATIRFIFEHLKAHRVRLHCDDTNVRSYRVAERCGLVREGHVQENQIGPDGTINGTLYYGLLKSEFEALMLRPPIVPQPDARASG